MSEVERFEKLTIEFGADCKNLIEKIIQMQRLLCNEICNVRDKCSLKDSMLSYLESTKVNQSIAPLDLLDLLPAFLEELRNHTAIMITKHLFGER